MYNDNLRIIHNLIDQNNEIRHQLVNIFNERRNNNRNNNNYNNQNTNPLNNQTNNRSTYSRIRQRVNNTNDINNSNNANINNRVIINDIPYILEEIQYIAPINNRRNNVLASEIGRMTGNFFDPINITPTQNQIDQATISTFYSDILNPTNNSCPISLENFLDTSPVTMIRPCRHVFNTESLMSWFNNSTRCPVCRYDIRNYSPSQIHDISNNVPENYDNNIINNDETILNTSNNINRTSNDSTSTTSNNINRRNIVRNFNNDQAFTLLDNLISEVFQDLSGNSSMEHFQPFFTYFSHNLR
jgi:hypothetical protein